ncbi:tRNA(Phe) (4-demethylwyosine(37)-C(7)) aminocarboxypropyltransferase [Aspergillus mulundensis]|uniref:tRNA wybutosine-synthesizing protein 2 n=1 Tax=Aspergillus mulundensis TaxID=1810919 RepID=A0A3D8QMJ9_9EURO|nr:tRNA wybutosine-synthesizing protein 2 [Aspergillus mulundensis]RDW62931.1 tRNA wybutosine-synthesizing protein 2 [Aspergillus mulundensis]
MADAPPLERNFDASMTKQRKIGAKHPRKQNINPLQKGIADFISAHLPPSLFPQHALSLEELASSLPKRYTIYEPMLLLPLNAFTHPPAWGKLYDSLDHDQRKALYASIASAFARYGVTHVAMNAPIVLTDTQGHENRMRSPVGLVPLHGDFGPPPSRDGEEVQPCRDDFEQAFWVRTVQNHGIVQIWAPLYTMFSRGNVTEKARILGHGSMFEGLDEVSLCGEAVDDVAVVDMYAGIGYFVFSYLKRGVKRVWGFEINGWSVEGLRRGCVENGWGCRVIGVGSDGRLSTSVPELVESLRDTDRVVIFHGDNGFAAKIMGQVRAALEARREWTSIRHVNLGLLPSSSSSWDDACKIIDKDKGGWLHVHENVDVQQIEAKGREITATVERYWTEYASQRTDTELGADCRHVEQVKTYAPGVMHCVYDVQLTQQVRSNVS